MNVTLFESIHSLVKSSRKKKNYYISVMVELNGIMVKLLHFCVVNSTLYEGIVGVAMSASKGDWVEMLRGVREDCWG